MTVLTAELRERIRAEIDKRARVDVAEKPELNETTRSVHDLDLLVALGQLTDDEREAWIDRLLVGDTLRRIASRMGLQPIDVRSLEFHAHQHLSEILGPDSDFAKRWADERWLEERAA